MPSYDQPLCTNLQVFCDKAKVVCVDSKLVRCPLFVARQSGDPVLRLTQTVAAQEGSLGTLCSD